MHAAQSMAIELAALDPKTGGRPLGEVRSSYSEFSSESQMLTAVSAEVMQAHLSVLRMPLR
jgi:hypothetical protein